MPSICLPLYIIVLFLPLPLLPHRVPIELLHWSPWLGCGDRPGHPLPTTHRLMFKGHYQIRPLCWDHHGNHTKHPCLVEDALRGEGVGRAAKGVAIWAGTNGCISTSLKPALLLNVCRNAARCHSTAAGFLSQQLCPRVSKYSVSQRGYNYSAGAR